MSPFDVSTSAHLAGTVVLALFFVLLERHDTRPYLRDWMAAWVAQGLALTALLFTSRRDWQTGFALYLFLETAHGVLLWLAARGYARGAVPGRLRLWLLAATVAWAAIGPLLFEARTLSAVQLAVLAVTSVAAAAALWRAPGVLGARLVMWMLALLGAVYAVNAAALVMMRGGVVPPAYLELAPFNVLLLQTLLAFGMVLTVMEEAQRALHTSNLQLQEAERRLKTLAETDPLTGCFNRRVFRDLVDDLRRGGGDTRGVVVMLDMDDLKAINDKQGHAAGDEAIRALADAIRARTRATDVPVRWGGDEFLVVMPGLSLAEGEERRDRIAETVAGHGLSASAGVGAYGDGVDIMAAVDAADRQMYAAKQRRDAT
jgi:diguanylate cyclase (GGDEF)-like protein